MNYINFYNKLIKLTTNKFLYNGINNKQDSFSDRLTLFLVHFAFILKEFKNSKNEKILQEIKNSTPSIVFKAHNLVVTLRNKSQLNTWLKLYPEGTYTIN